MPQTVTGGSLAFTPDLAGQTRAANRDIGSHVNRGPASTASLYPGSCVHCHLLVPRSQARANPVGIQTNCLDHTV